MPSISGFALLALVMEHEACKNIPVISTMVIPKVLYTSENASLLVFCSHASLLLFEMNSDVFARFDKNGVEVYAQRCC